MLRLAATVENREVTRLGFYRKDSTGSALTGKRLGTDPLRYRPFCSRGRGLQLCFGTNPIRGSRLRAPRAPPSFNSPPKFRVRTSLTHR